jgi:hypothetical protein
MPRKISSRALALLAFIFAFLALSVSAQDKTPASEEGVNLDGIIKETQKSFTNKGHAGIVWWIPTEFWEAAATKHGTTPEHARKTFEPLRNYVVVAVTVLLPIYLATPMDCFLFSNPYCQISWALWARIYSYCSFRQDQLGGNSSLTQNAMACSRSNSRIRKKR